MLLVLLAAWGVRLEVWYPAGDATVFSEAEVHDEP